MPQYATGMKIMCILVQFWIIQKVKMKLKRTTAVLTPSG